nr:reverse transcriptase domain-containing protein [Tanacetum cinerariifolium]
YGTFAYRRMPFGLCNAPGTFQRCMLATFHDMVENTMEVFMDDFSVFGNSFDNCLSRLYKMLQRCEDTNLSLNWEKSHFMVKEGIVLGHKISKNGIEVDRAKVDVIAKLPHPTTVKGIRSFLSHAGFYQRFIQDFSKISRPMTHLLEKNTPFVFSEDCIQAFQTLKKKLTEAPILIAPNWDLPFELMCDASDFAIGAVLGQRHEKHFKPIHYASKTMNDAETNYTTTEKEMLFFPRAEQERLKREYHSILQTNTETSMKFMQRFLRLAGFLGAAAGIEEEQAKNFQWGLRRNNRNSGYGRDQRNRVSSPTDLPILVPSSPGVPLRATPTQFALLVDVDTQESVVELLADKKPGASGRVF